MVSKGLHGEKKGYCDVLTHPAGGFFVQWLQAAGTLPIISMSAVPECVTDLPVDSKYKYQAHSRPALTKNAKIYMG